MDAAYALDQDQRELRAACIHALARKHHLGPLVDKATRGLVHIESLPEAALCALEADMAAALHTKRLPSAA